MTLAVGDAILPSFLDEFDVVLASAKLRLYSNNRTPDNTDVLASYTESTAGGYAQITLTATPPAAGATVASVTTKTWPAQVFAFTGAGNIYGYYVTDSTGTILLWAERYATPPFVAANGLTFTVTPKLSLKPF